MNINLIQTLVRKQHSDDKTGHGMDHIDRVLRLSWLFAKPLHVDLDVVSLIALLHDVDDYKIVGIDQARLYQNALSIMGQGQIPLPIQETVLASIQRMGYSRLLEGIRPTTIEGCIVSDADMCDAMGANGILRMYAYGQSKGQPFFNREVFPTPMIDANAYRQHGSAYTIHHFFDKLLKLKDLMMTTPGKQEASHRHQFMVDFLTQYFHEEDAPEWQQYIKDFLS
jgi:uncharacterized protein